MKTEKKAFITIVILIFITFVSALIKQRLTIRFFSDLFFMIALFFLMAGALWSVLASGFFDFFQKSFHQLLFSRKKQNPKEFMPFSEVAAKRPLYWFEVGICFLLLALALLLF